MRRQILFLLTIILFSFFLSCQKEYSLELPTTDSAAGSLQDSLGTCLYDSVYGTYYNGVAAGSDTAYVQLEVNVTAIGAYSIHTDLQNGFEFADSGFFTTVGINTIKLKPFGTAIIHTPTIFTVSFDSSSCMFSVNVKDSTGTGLGGSGGTTDTTATQDSSWAFQANAATFSGQISSARSIDTIGVSVLELEGFTASMDTLFTLSITLPTGSIEVGSYQSTSDVFFGFIDEALGSIIYQASPSTPAVSVIVNITSYNATTHYLTGNFGGNATDGSGSGTRIPINNGTFEAYVR